MRKRHTTEQFIEDILCSEVHPDGKYSYKFVEYTGNDKKIEIYCNTCNKSFWQSSHNHKKGKGCPECYGNIKHTTEQFIEDILCDNTHQEGKYNYKMVDYITTAKKIQIYCNDCGKYFIQTPNNHKRGKGCPYCKANKLSQKYSHTIDDISQRLTIEENPIEVNGEIQCRCTYCKEYFTPTKPQLKNRIISLSGKKSGECRLYCSNECKQLCPIFGKSKYYDSSTKPDTSRPDQPELRRLTLERDNFTCQRCGSTEDLVCHHYTGTEVNPVESADVNNCITLCHTCHIRVHSSGQCDVIRQPCIT